MKIIRCKLLNKKDLNEVSRVIKSCKDVRVLKRALILKSIHMGRSQISIDRLGLAKDRTVRNILKRYNSTGLKDALFDQPRSGQPRRFTKRQEEKITAIACTNPPIGQSRWSLELLKEVSERTGIVTEISREALRIMLSSREIKPWRHKMWCIPVIDQEFIRCMEDVLRVYEKPWDPREPVVCLDEKPVQLLTSKREEVIGKIIKQDYEYKRQGVVNAFCAIEPKAGKHFIIVRKRKTMKDFAAVVKKIIMSYPNAKTIHLVMDNLSTHKEKALTETFGEKEGKKLWKKIQPHYTPKHASWLNQAEIEIGMFNRGCIGKQRVADINELRRRSSAWCRRMNRKKIKINWTFSRRKARVKFKYKSGKN